jgi:TRAP-type C4-dicarboxylate transport system permease small subunit
VRSIRAILSGTLTVLRWLTRCYLAILMLTILALTTTEAIDRYALHTTFDAYEQLATAGVAWVTFFGYALGYHERANLRVELVDMMLPPWLSAIKRMIFDVCILFLAAMVNLTGWRVLEVASNQDIIGTPFTNAIVYWSLQSGTILIGLYAIGHLAQAALSLQLSDRPGSEPVVPPAA